MGSIELELNRGIKISDLLSSGSTFSFDTGDINGYQEEEEEDNDFTFHPDAENFKITFNKPFNELKTLMSQENEYIWKKIYKEVSADTPKVDFNRHRVTYHRNFYMENEDYPFDSTYLNQKPGVICFDTEQYLPGLIDALSTMRKGEKAYFIISYKKMFKKEGCPPRILPESDILCDLYVMNLEEVGDEEAVQQLKEEKYSVKTFEEAKTLVEEGRLRAKDMVKQENYKKAITIYKQMLQVLSFCKTSSKDEEKEITIMNIQILTNLVTCYNIQEKPKEALMHIESIEKICDISENPKILFAKAKALRLNGDFKQAQDVIKTAYALRPTNKDILIELEKLAKAIGNYKELSWKL